MTHNRPGEGFHLEGIKLFFPFWEGRVYEDSKRERRKRKQTDEWARQEAKGSKLRNSGIGFFCLLRGDSEVLACCSSVVVCDITSEWLPQRLDLFLDRVIVPVFRSVTRPVVGFCLTRGTFGPSAQTLELYCLSIFPPLLNRSWKSSSAEVKCSRAGGSSLCASRRSRWLVNTQVQLE